MEWFGRSNKDIEFEMFSGSHFFVMTIFITIVTAIFLTRKKLNGEKWRRYEIGVAISLILFEATFHLWMYVNGIWKVSRSLPLEICNISLVLCVSLLLTRKKIVFEILFFLAILGCTQAIFTPALTYDFPHFRFFHFFYAHLMVVWVTLYFTWTKGYRPTFWSVVKLLVFLNTLLPVILFTNKKVGRNYWFLRHKPDGHSLMDLLGPYPWYIFSLEGLLIIFSLLVWLFFRKKGKNQGDTSNLLKNSY